MFMDNKIKIKMNIKYNTLNNKYTINLMLTIQSNTREQEYDVTLLAKKELLISALIYYVCSKESENIIDTTNKLLAFLIKLGFLHKDVTKKKYNKIKFDIIKNIISLCKETPSKTIEMNLSKNITLSSPDGIVYKNYVVEEKINEGAYGKIYKIKHTIDQNYYAMKVTEYTVREKWDTEVKIISNLSSTNIIRYYNSWIDYDFKNKKDKLFLYSQIELCDTDLSKYIEKATEEELIKNHKKIYNQILDALEYVHSQNIIHRDIKPSNILLKFENNNINVKISDFGCAKISNEYNHFYFPSSSSIGTELYCAPEIKNTSEYDKSIDIYSVGLILLELSHFFKTKMERLKTIENIKNKKQEPCEYNEIIMPCLDDKKNRPSIKEIRELFNSRN